MNKLKINNGLAAIILLASLFAGWQTLLLVVILMLIFCELNDKIKNLMISVVAFFAGLTLVSLAWSLISDGIDLAFKGIESIVSVINSYLSISNRIDIINLQAKFITPVKTILTFLDSGISYLILFTKFAFIVSVLAGTTMKENPFNKKVSEFIQKILNFTNNFEPQVAPQVNNNVAVNNATQVNQSPVNNNRPDNLI